MRRPRLAALGWLCWIYALLIGGWLLLSITAGDRLWWVGVLSDLALALFVPVPVLLALALWSRRRAALLALLPPLLAGLALFGTPFLPWRSHAPQPGSQPFTVMSFNVLYSNRDFAAIGAAVRAAHPDLVGLQELTPKLASTIAANLADEYPYHAFSIPEHASGVGLLSRFPIETSRSFALPPRQASLHALVRVERAPLHVVVAHLLPNRKFGTPPAQLPVVMSDFYAQRAGEVAAIEREVRPVREPLVLMCDCNMPDTSAAHRAMSGFLSDSFYEVGWGFGFTQPAGGWAPLQRIDYVWHTAGLTALQAHVGQPGGSDHLPIVAELQLDPPASEQ